MTSFNQNNKMGFPTLSTIGTSSRRREREMKNIRHENGEKVFRISECLSSSQIASYFARYGKKSAKENQDNPVINGEDLTSVLSAIGENNLMELLSWNSISSVDWSVTTNWIVILVCIVLFGWHSFMVIYGRYMGFHLRV